MAHEFNAWMVREKDGCFSLFGSEPLKWNGRWLESDGGNTLIQQIERTIGFPEKIKVKITIEVNDDSKTSKKAPGKD